MEKKSNKEIATYLSLQSLSKWIQKRGTDVTVGV